MVKRLAVFALALAVPVAASATTFTYYSILSGAAESPPTGSAGTGSATVIYDDVAHTLAVTADFSGLTGTTAAAHIHCCFLPPPASPNAGVATTVPSFPGFPLGVTFGGYSQTFDLTQASSFNPAFITANGGTPAGAEARLALGLSLGQTYFNIHTSSFLGGEIRGDLALIPEPGTLVLVGLGTAGLAVVRRRGGKS
jgi:hypothetical protein